MSDVDIVAVPWNSVKYMICKDKFGNIIKKGDRVRLEHTNGSVEYFTFGGINGSKKDLIYFDCFPITSDFKAIPTKIDLDSPKGTFVKIDPLTSQQLEII